MLVATFGPATGWEGREIIWDVDRFILVGYGYVPAAGVLDYDRLAQLVWASPELRPWVAAVAQWEAGGRPASPGQSALASPGQSALSSPGAATGGAVGGPAATSRRGLPAWAVVLIVLGAAFVVISIVLAIVVPVFIFRTTETLAHDAAVRSGVRTIQIGVESYAVDHGEYPAPGEVNSVGFSRYISAWPVNPYTDMPMAPGDGPGCFRYEPGGGGGTYRLTGFGRDGGIVIDLTGGSDTTV